MIPVMVSGRTTNQRIALKVPIGSPGWSPSSRLFDSANAGKTDDVTKTALADDTDQMRRMLVFMCLVYDNTFSTRLRPMTSKKFVAKIGS
jgi:hypothetical protein